MTTSIANLYPRSIPALRPAPMPFAFLPLALLLVALPAAAHPGHAEASGMLAGLAHPFTGVDHLLALLGVGLWSRQQARGPLQAGAFVALFVLMMALGALVQVDIPIEPAIAATVALIGALLVAAVRLPAGAALALVALFAALHGQAHGRELSGAASMAGFLLASAALLLAGRLMAGPRLSRFAGAAIGATGLVLLAGAA